MKRFEILLPEIQKIYDSIPDTFNRSLCITHHFHVLNAIKKLTDNECLYVAALLHDISLYLGIHGNHAKKSSEFAKKFLEDKNIFSCQEIQLIYDVIALHSDKNTVHFHEAQLLKQADIEAHRIENL